MLFVLRTATIQCEITKYAESALMMENYSFEMSIITNLLGYVNDYSMLLNFDFWLC